MNLVRRTNDPWNPARDFQELQEQINSLFDFGYPEMSGLFDRHLSPPVDIIEEDEGFLVTVDVPGVDKEDLDIAITRNILTVKGVKHEESKQKNRKSYRSESWSGSFQRTLSLPESVDPDKVEAQLKNGVLSIRVAKREELKPRQIAIQVR